MTNISDSIRQYVRKARKTRNPLLSFSEFNVKFNTNLPTDEAADIEFNRFKTSYNRMKKLNGLPIQGRLYNLLKGLQKENGPVRAPSLKRELIPPVENSLSPMSARAIQHVVKKPKVEARASAVEAAVGVPEEKIYTLDHFKQDLESWKQQNPNSKLNKETQIVYFVPNQRIENMEHYAAKLTRNTGKILETGGIFKMRSGMKKEILGLDSKVASDIVASVTNGGKGPFFLPINCVTGASVCNC